MKTLNELKEKILRHHLGVNFDILSETGRSMIFAAMDEYADRFKYANPSTIKPEFDKEEIINYWRTRSIAAEAYVTELENQIL